MAQPISLEVQARALVGKKVKKLRADGVVPANIFGAGVKSTSVQVNLKDFAKVYDVVGETGLVELKLAGQAHPVLVHQIQKEPKSDSVLHVDFHQVNLKEKTTAHVPVVLVGEAPIEKSKEGLVLQSMNEVEIEALPTDIPHNIEIDVSSLTEIGQVIQVKDLKVDKTVLSVQSAEIKEVEPEPEVPAEVEVITEKAEGEEGAEAPAEGEAPAPAPEGEKDPVEGDKSKE